MTAPKTERVSVEAAISRNRIIYDLVIDSLSPAPFKKKEDAALIVNTNGKMLNFSPIALLVEFWRDSQAGYLEGGKRHLTFYNQKRLHREFNGQTHDLVCLHGLPILLTKT